uniref:Uncharacterized protein n=1 Tax=Arundo donax TaxID=35708 RepID=A0A0A9DAC9_ARUDO
MIAACSTCFAVDSSNSSKFSTFSHQASCCRGPSFNISDWAAMNLHSSSLREASKRARSFSNLNRLSSISVISISFVLRNFMSSLSSIFSSFRTSNSIRS